MRRSTTRLLVCVAGAYTALATSAAAQIPADEYLTSMPLGYPTLVRQTSATERFRLYGDREDPGYRDVEPLDGIDDRRATWLRELATRFAPIFIRNTPMFPMDFRTFYDRPDFGIHIDTWDLARHEETLVEQTTIPLGELAARPCVSGEPDTNADCRLRDLITAYGGHRDSIEPEATAGAEQQRYTVMYLDMPGFDEATWKAEYWGEDDSARSPTMAGSERTFIHPFIAETAETSREPSGFELVLQYWFFYPANDSGNNHEGDWEHINVIVSPLSLVERPLDTENLTRLIADQAIDGEDPLVIRRLEYYLHHYVYPMDFSSPNAYGPRGAWERQVAAEPGGRWTLDRIRERAWQDAAETRINTRPVVWIGGDSIGLASALQKPGLRDRDGHPSYPFRGYYKGIGPGTAERVTHDFDLQQYFTQPSSAPAYVDDYADPARIQLTPDWERIADLMEQDAQLRRDWGWLVLPLRFGFPASPSPGAAQLPLAHADLGNVAPVGPAFNGGWNRVGDASGYELYDAIKESWTRPSGTLDSFFPRLGWFNAPILFFLFKPPLDLAWRSVALPVRALTGNRLPTFSRGSAPAERVLSVEVGAMVTPVSEDFQALFTNRDQLVELAVRLALALPDLENLDRLESKKVFPTIVAPEYSLTFHLSPRFSAESSFVSYKARVGIDVTAENLANPIEIRGTLDQFDFHGNTRFNLMTGQLQPYLIYGGGLTSYRLTGVTVDNHLLLTPDSPRFRPKGSWVSFGFNELILGGGMDLIGAQLGNASVGLRGAYTAVHHRLGFEREAGVEFSTNLAKELAGNVSSIWRHEFRILGSISF